MFDLFAQLDDNAARICDMPDGYAETPEGRAVQDELLEAIDERARMVRELKRGKL